MPLPFILGGIALAVAGYGVKKGLDAYDDNKEAEDLHNQAQNRYKEAEIELKEKQEIAQNAFESLGALQEKIVNTSLERYKGIVDKLNIEDRASWQEIVGEESLRRLVNVRDAIVDLGTVLGSVVGSAAAGAMAGFGAWVLGGIVAAPVIAVAASVFASKAKERKYDAKSYYDSVHAVCVCMESEGLTWRNIVCKAQEKEYGLHHLDEEFQEVLGIVERCMQTKGLNAHTWSQEEKNQVKILMQQAETLTITISTPLMHDSDPLTQELKKHQQECQELMKKIQERWG
ncbi:hypothetical protein [Helicobacter pylori]|uniref:Proteobacterial sortase system OmpA family protein n=2 Tax=Helicobacter pylori TaxID=210 RepID=K2KMG7_HELPX|nr:hypothetical protein [Helicobacter pylori]EKE78655.1 hypothetical protein OUC_1684 [Helicobacter pylori R018c]EKE95997.1 hypothetical protein OUS_0059 [Helicobacter pylori R056a]